MVGKFFLIAAVCVSLAQVQGDELENAIKSGLNKIKNLNLAGQRRIDAALTDVTLKKQLIQSKTKEFIQKSVRVQDGVREAVGNVAETVREKARESNKPPSVFQCIDRIEERANNQVRTLTRKFESDVRRLETVKVANIETDSRPLNGFQKALKVRYERAVQIIQDCDSPRSVEIAVNSCARWLDLLYSDIGRIRGQVATILRNYQRDANNYFTNSNRQINQIKSASLRNIRQCLYNREAILEEYFEEY